MVENKSYDSDMKNIERNY